MFPWKQQGRSGGRERRLRGQCREARGIVGGEEGRSFGRRAWRKSCGEASARPSKKNGSYREVEASTVYEIVGGRIYNGNGYMLHEGEESAVDGASQ